MSNLRFDFQGKSVLVTGGAQGIGRQITEMFLASGARVAVWDYSEEALQSARTELERNFSGRIQFERVDITKPESCNAASAKLNAPEHFQDGNATRYIDFLINNAGITRDKSFSKMTQEDWDAVIQTNLSGIFHVTKSVFERFDAQSAHKRIVNLSSVVALYGNFGQTNYVAAKAGVIGLTKTWAREFARKGFTVNAIAPGFVDTQLTRKMPKEAIDALVAKIAVPRLGQPSDIARACLFLCSEEASYINGITLSVDGGLSV